MYLSLGPDGKPLQTYLKPIDNLHPTEEEWETKDYVELPMSKSADKKEKENSFFSFIS